MSDERKCNALAAMECERPDGHEGDHQSKFGVWPVEITDEIVELALRAWNPSQLGRWADEYHVRMRAALEAVSAQRGATV